MERTPDVIVFDVNETLSDMAPLARAFTAVGAPEGVAATWFAGILRGGFAAAAIGDNVAFADIAQDSLTRSLTELDVTPVEEAAGAVMDALRHLGVHPDVVPGSQALASVAELVTLSNGAAQVAEKLLGEAGVREHFTHLLSVADAPVWKPAKAAYDHAATVCGTDPSRMLLVAVHPWDIHGAHAAGMRTAWLNRTGAAYPRYFSRAGIEIPDLPALARQLAADT